MTTAEGFEVISLLWDDAHKEIIASNFHQDQGTHTVHLLQSTAALSNRAEGDRELLPEQAGVWILTFCPPPFAHTTQSAASASSSSLSAARLPLKLL